MVFPHLYPIIDFSLFVSQPDPVATAGDFANELLAAGATIIQLRSKVEPPENGRFLSCARELRRMTRDRAALIINDRIDICLAADADGVHLGQDDLSPLAARKIFDQIKDDKKRIIGFSTHNPEQLREADAFPVDYIAIGPVFATSSKTNPDPVIGNEGVRLARGITTKPLVAIGGITRRNCAQVKD